MKKNNFGEFFDNETCKNIDELLNESFFSNLFDRFKKSDSNNKVLLDAVQENFKYPNFKPFIKDANAKGTYIVEHIARHIVFLLRSAGVVSYKENYVHTSSSHSWPSETTGELLVKKFLKNPDINFLLDHSNINLTSPSPEDEAIIDGIIDKIENGSYPLDGYDPESNVFSPKIFGKKWAKKSSGWTSYRKPPEKVKNHSQVEIYLMHLMAEAASKISGPDDLLSKLNMISQETADRNEKNERLNTEYEKLSTFRLAKFSLKNLSNLLQSSISPATKKDIMLLDEIILETITMSGNEEIVFSGGTAPTIIDDTGEQLKLIIKESLNEIYAAHLRFILGEEDSEIKAYIKKSRNLNNAIKSFYSVQSIVKTLQRLGITSARGVFTGQNMNGEYIDFLKILDSATAPKYSVLFNKSFKDEQRLAAFTINKPALI